jgi:hypothetical protein
VSLSALQTGRPLPPGRFLVLISVTGWVKSRAIVWLEWLSQLKIQRPHRHSNLQPSVLWGQQSTEIFSCPIILQFWHSRYRTCSIHSPFTQRLTDYNLHTAQLFPYVHLYSVPSISTMTNRWHILPMVLDLRVINGKAIPVTGHGGPKDCEM